MPLAVTRDGLLADFDKASIRLSGLVDGISAPRARLGPLGESPCDRLSYLLGWGALLLSWEATECAGGVAVMPAPGFRWNELGRLNRSFYEGRAAADYVELRGQWKAQVATLRGWILESSEEALFMRHQRVWCGDKWPLAKWLQVNTIAPYRRIATELGRWTKEWG
ncbi:ClbS/DfsB family four-helix bundle protein [Aeromonas diversa]|uniref:ClbS/DfsB family four-helix bundle protein n=1 Tax=Aeromonas diversa TaxID=502790 RepID=UPI003462EEF8